MDELRFVRRDDRALIVVDDNGTEFRFVVDDAVLSELRHLGRRERDTSKVRPREIQALIRSGKSLAQAAQATGLEEIDIERYAEPVLAERRYILERAHAVAVRTDAGDDEEQRFGTVIAERLISLGSDTSEWSSWRDDEAGWMIGLEFISHDVAHQATWAFEHRKGTLSPVTPDAVNLSKQGDVGDRLIPKLRVVDDREQRGRFDTDAFDEQGNTAETPAPAADAAGSSAPEAAPTTPIQLASARQHTGAPNGAADGAPGAPAPTATPVVAQDPPASPAPSSSDSRAEYDRRREIDQRAIKTNDHEPVDLSQTADLLDALRKRRGERAQSARDADAADTEQNAPARPQAAPERQTPTAPVASKTPQDAPAAEPASEAASEEAPRPRSIWAAAGVTGTPRGQAATPAPAAPAAPTTPAVQAAPAASPSDAPREKARPESAEGARNGADSSSAFGAAANTQNAAPAQAEAEKPKADTERPGKKKRASIPSWDDILFGTRSDDDPA